MFDGFQLKMTYFSWLLLYKLFVKIGDIFFGIFL